MTSVAVGLTPSQIAALSAPAAGAFTTSDVNAQTTAALSAAQLNVLSASDLKAFGVPQVNAITARRSPACRWPRRRTSRPGKPVLSSLRSRRG